MPRCREASMSPPTIRIFNHCSASAKRSSPTAPSKTASGCFDTISSMTTNGRPSPSRDVGEVMRQMTLQDVLLAAKVSVKRLAAATRPPAQPVRVADVLGDTAGKSVVDQFHRLWYNSDAAAAVNWRGCPVLKSPFDLWMYQELIASTRPDVIIETGTHRRGYALFFSDDARLADHPLEGLTVDFNPKLAYDPAAHRIFPIRGISTAPATVAQVKAHLSTIR